MLDSLEETTHGEYEIETIAVIDDDEESRQIALKRCTMVDYSSVLRGALNCWNLGLAMSTGDILMPAGDDQKFYPGWAEFALESWKNKLDSYGVVGMNDLAYDGDLQLATMFMFDRQFCKDHLGGVIAPPVYQYYCIDSEINAKAKLLNKFFWDKRSIIEHLHPAHGKRELDIHDLSRMKDKIIWEDNKIFEQRKAAGFPVVWEPVI
jgi:hypothetical protein